MRTSADAIYLDSSALVKLVVIETESHALLEFLRGARQVSCALAHVEVIRAVRGRGAEAVRRAREVLGEIDLLPLDHELLDRATELGPVALRSLDAIHLAAALVLGSALSEVVTYDRRMAGAAQDLGLVVAAPGWSLAP